MTHLPYSQGFFSLKTQALSTVKFLSRVQDLGGGCPARISKHLLNSYTGHILDTPALRHVHAQIQAAQTHTYFSLLPQSTSCCWYMGIMSSEELARPPSFWLSHLVPWLCSCPLHIFQALKKPLNLLFVPQLTETDWQPTLPLTNCMIWINWHFQNLASLASTLGSCIV